MESPATAQPVHSTSEGLAARREDGSWLVDGSLATDDLRELLQLDELPNERDDHYYTLATATAQNDEAGMEGG